MTSVLLFLLLFFVILTAGLALTTHWTQGWFYDRVVEQLAIRSAIAGGAITAMLGLWSLIEAKAPGRLDSVFRFSTSDAKAFDQFWSERTVAGKTVQTMYRRKVVPPGRVEYTDDAGRVWRRSDSGVVTAIVVEEDGEKKRFAAKLDASGNFLRDPRDQNKTLDVEYVEEGGKRRVMTESDIGAINSSRYGAFVLNVLFNLVLIGIWVAVFALALGFDWGRATALGVIGWVVISLFVWPALTDRINSPV